jgi:hypothetical protein
MASRRQKASSSSTVRDRDAEHVPPEGMASRALTARLRKVVWSRDGSPMTERTAERELAAHVDAGVDRVAQEAHHLGDDLVDVDGVGAHLAPAEKARSWPVRSAARSEAVRMASRSARLGTRRRGPAQELGVAAMVVRRLLKSWATPPARRPIASIFCACWSCSRIDSRSRSARSRSAPPARGAGGRRHASSATANLRTTGVSWSSSAAGERGAARGGTA